MQQMTCNKRKKGMEELVLVPRVRHGNFEESQGKETWVL